jgi:hypothetical protein
MITWADGAIRNTWLEVTTVLTDCAGVKTRDVFYYGNLVGDTDTTSTRLAVTAQDFVRTRQAVGTREASSDLPYDHNRDGRVNVIDVALVRRNLGSHLANLSAPVAPQTAFAPGDVAAAATALVREERQG